MIALAQASSAVGSEIFFLITILVIGSIVLLVLRHFLPLRTTPAYQLVPIFFALLLPASIVLLVPIDLASNARDEDVGSRGIWLPNRLLLVAWRISYWLTFALTWFILPILAEYADAGYREPKGRLLFSLRVNAQYYGLVLAASILGLIYFFISSGASPESLKGLVMALAYCWGLILAIYLMGHGLVAIPRRLFRSASISGNLKRTQAHAAKIHEKMEDAIQDLEELEAQVTQLAQRKTGSAVQFQDWIEELADDSHLPESRPRTLTRRMSAPQVSVPNVITERFLADLTRNITRARHARSRYLDEWDHVLHCAADMQATLDALASKRIDIGQSSPETSAWNRFTILTPWTRFLFRCYFIPYSKIALGVIFSLASFCIVWSEFIKTINPLLSIIAVTIVHHPTSERGMIGFAGQVIAAFWIVYMCAAALTSLTEVKVWRGRALVRRNTHGESAMWYAMQVAKLSVPLAFNFITFLDPVIYKETVFYSFLGKLIDLTPLGEWFNVLFPCFILIPVCATLFGLYSKVKSCFGLDGVIEDEDDDDETGYGTGSWREGRDLIERELHGASSLGRLGAPIVDRHAVTDNSMNHSVPARSAYPTGRPRPSAPRSNVDPPQGADRNPEDETFFEAFGHRVKNTMDTVQTPKWLQNVGDGFKRPKWMGGNEEGGESSRNDSNFTRWFGGNSRQEGRVRL